MNFEEKQSFWSWWMIILMCFLLLSTLDFEWVSILNGNLKEVNITPAFWIVVLLIIVFSFVRLKTRINSEGIRIHFFPFLLKARLITWAEVSRIYVKDYNPISDYGGWGMRIGKEGKAYNTKGSCGAQIIFKDGSNLLIGTQKKNELKSIVSSINQKILKNEYE